MIIFVIATNSTLHCLILVIVVGEATLSTVVESVKACLVFTEIANTARIYNKVASLGI